MKHTIATPEPASHNARPTPSSPPRQSRRRALRERRGFTLFLGAADHIETRHSDVSTMPDRHLACRLAHQGVFAEVNTPNERRLW